MEEQPRDRQSQDEPYALVYVQPADDVASICGKIDTSPHQRVVLVVSPSSRALNSRLSLTILSHHAEAAGRHIVLVAPKGNMRRWARRERIAAFRAIRSVQFESEPPARPRISLGRTIITLPTYRSMMRYGTRAFVVLALVIPAYLFVPSADVVVYPKGRLVSRSLTVAVSEETGVVDAEAMAVPLHSLKVPLEMTVALPTTQMVAIPEGFATGIVRFINQTGDKIAVPSGSEVATGNGVVFLTQAEADVPAGDGKTVEVKVIAKEAGRRGNVGVTDIVSVRGELRSRLLVTNPAPIEGGSDTESLGVKEQDVAQLRALVLQVMREEGLKRLAQQEASGLSVYPETARVSLDGITFNAKVGDASPWLIATAKGEMLVSTVELQALQALALEEMALSAPEQEEIWVIEGSFRVVESSLQQPESGEASLTLRAEMEVLDGLSKGGVLGRLRGRSVSSAKSYLNDVMEFRSAPTIDIMPGWGFGIPRFNWRIDFHARSLNPTDDIPQNDETAEQKADREIASSR